MTWDDLRELRRNGMRPALPVLVTTANDCHTYEQEGFAVVRHEAGKPFPVELLDGLRVLLFLGSCDRASAVVRAMVNREVRPAELRAWCECFRVLDGKPMRCETVQQWMAA